MNSITRSTHARSVLFSIASRLLVGYLIFKTFGATRVAESASVIDASNSCSASKLQDSINEAIAKYGAIGTGKSSVSKVAVELFKKCNVEFLEKNSISEDVRQTVNTWLDMDLGKSEADNLMVAYQQALINPKPKITEKFASDCKGMKESYESFRDNTIELGKYVDVASGALLTEDGQVSENERALFNYVIYSQMCSLLFEDK